MKLATPLVIFTILLKHHIASEPSVKNPNIALLKPAMQSSVDGSLGAHYAVDGNIVTDDFGVISKILQSDYWQWWMVDLEDIYTIISFRLNLLSQCCAGGQDVVIMEVTPGDPRSLAQFPGLITNAEICFSFTAPPEKFITYLCDEPVTGRYIRIVRQNHNGVSLLVGEFEAYTHVEPDVITNGTPFNNNLALNKPARASSTYSSYEAGKAFDGILDGILLRSLSCMHTDSRQTASQWVTVDLQDLFVVDSVRIMNRLDCCPNRNQNFTIEMSQEDPAMNGFPGNNPGAQVCHKQIEIMTYARPVIYICDRPILARYVSMVLKTNTGHLHICELEVFSNVKNNHFKKVSTSGNPTAPTSPIDRRYVLNCMQLHGTNLKNKDTVPYIHVDLDSGQCRFLQSEDEIITIPSVNWTAYRAV